MRIPVGTRLGHYEILAALGAGGMGEVYRARDTRLHRAAAIKVITETEDDPDRVKRLEREALSASALNHPNILTVYELGAHDGLTYIATELVEGETLRDAIRKGPLPWPKVLDIAMQVGAALDAAHAAGIVHRDIKPENVMVRPDGYVKVLDFGIAKLIETSPAAADSATLTVQTVAGMLVGTVGYMSPEQVRGLPVDHRADVWSVGVVIHEMLAGRSPFTGQTMSDVIAAVLERTPPSLSASGVEAPFELERILAKALTKDREARYQTMKELVADLGHVRSAPAVATHVRSRRSSFLIASALSGVAVAAILGGALIRDKVGGGSRELPPPPVSTSTGGRTLSYFLSIQAMRGGEPIGEPVNATGSEPFPRSSKFRLNFTSQDRGFVYLINDARVAEKRLLRLLYPTPSVRAGSAQIDVGEVVSTGYYYPQSELEHVWIVWAENLVPVLEQARKWVNAEDRGEIKDPAQRAEILNLLLGADGKSAITSERPGRVTLHGRGDVVAHRVELRTR